MKTLRKTIGHSLMLQPIKKMGSSRRDRLINILKYTNGNAPFYKGKFDAFLANADTMSDEDFFYAYSHLPIATKDDLKTRNDAFIPIHLAHKVDLLEGGKTPELWPFIKHALIKKDFKTSISTGGSSGVPAFRWLDYNDANVFAQSFLHSFKLNGWHTGESFVVYYPLKSYFTGSYAAHAKTLNRVFGFTMVPFETVTKESVEELLATLRKTKATLLVIFPCVLQRIAEIMKAENIPPFEHLPYINVSGEFFLDCSKKFIQSMFPDSDIQSTYGAVEFGEIAHQSGLSSFDYDIFNDYAYIEQGANNTILVTAYRQRAFPLVRYQIEDMGRVVNHPDGRQSLNTLEGKNTDYLVGADGYIYYASFFNALINEINKAFGDPVIHFTLRHSGEDEGGTMRVSFVLQDHSKKDLVEKAARENLENVFPNYATIAIDFPDHFDHDYTRKFKIIGEGDGLAEVVGGYYQRKAS